MAAEKKNRISDAIARVVCVFLAFCLWVYVMVVESPDYEMDFSGVTVELTGTDILSENNLAVYNGYGTLVDITLSGKKSVMDEIGEGDIVVTADVGSITTGGRSTCKVTVDVPAGCKLVGISQDTISVYVDESDKISVTLTEIRENTNLPDGCFTGTVELPVDSVTVSGPAMELSKIKKAVVEIDMTGVTKTSTMTRAVYLTNASGEKIDSPYIEYYPDEVTVTVPVLKTVRVTPQVVFRYGFLDSDSASLSVVPEYIDVTGEPSVVDAGGLIGTIYIDEKTDFLTSSTITKTVNLEAPEGCTLSSSKLEITASLGSSISTREITIPADNIIDIGANEGVDYIIDDSDITVTLMGRKNELRYIEPGDIALVIDMSPYTATNTGTVKVRASVVIEAPDGMDIIETGTYDIGVTFIEK